MANLDLKQFAADKRLLDYLAPKKALLVDPSGQVRGLARKLLKQFGMEPNAVILAESYEEAEKIMATTKPQIVFCEHPIRNRSGLDILQLLKTNHSGVGDRMFVLVSDKNSPTLAAVAAEEDADLLLVKPLSYVAIEEEFLRAIAPKVTSTEYLKTLAQGQKLLEANQAEQSLALFKKAQALDPAPVLSHFYQGQALLSLGNTEQASEAFKAGLGVDPTHHKCSMALYKILFEKKSYQEAYALIRKLSQTFPLNPKRIPEICRLAIINKSYPDIEDIYNLFNSLEEKDDEIGTSVAAGLVIYGKYIITQKDNAKAADILLKATQVSNRKPKIVIEVIRVLLTAGLTSESDALLKKLPDETRALPDVQLLLLDQCDLKEPSTVVMKFCQDLLQQGVKSARVYELFIKHSIKSNRAMDRVEELVSEAETAFPENKELFRSLLKT